MLITGQYHQYDSMAYPQMEQETKRSFLRIISEHIFQSSTKDEMVIPQHDAMQSYALEVYLDDFKLSLYNCKISDIEATTKHLHHIFNKLNNPETINDREIKAWPCQDLSQVSNTTSIVYTCVKYSCGR